MQRSARAEEAAPEVPQRDLSSSNFRNKLWSCDNCNAVLTLLGRVSAFVKARASLTSMLLRVWCVRSRGGDGNLRPSRGYVEVAPSTSQFVFRSCRSRAMQKTFVRVGEEVNMKLRLIYICHQKIIETGRHLPIIVPISAVGAIRP